MLRYQNLATPVQMLDKFVNNANSIEVFIKRDDLIHPFISGNKWRKLKGYLEHIKSKGISQIVTFGGAYSNHLIATACAGAIHGVKTKAFVRGDYADVNNPVLTLCRIYGMELCLVSKDKYKELNSFVNPIEQNAFWIKEGGFGDFGTIGCVEIIDELQEKYDHIVCAVGTGTTVAGLLKGVSEKQLKTKVHGIAVLKNASYLESEIEQLVPLTNFELHTDFHFGGYAKVNQEITDFIKHFAQRFGILLDPIYTAKMMLATKYLCESGHFKPFEKILCIHTGGLTGLIAEKMIKKF